MACIIICEKYADSLTNMVFTSLHQNLSKKASQYPGTDVYDQGLGLNADFLLRNAGHSLTYNPSL